MPTASRMKIAIIGAGPAGCMLARLLHTSNIDIQITIFEREESLNFQSQGGTLDLHPKSGIAALKAGGLYKEFLQKSRSDGSALGVCDKKGIFYFRLPASKAGMPEIDRVELRKLLVDSLPGDIIKWNHRLVKIDEQLNLHFENGVEKGFDLIVGADGAWSSVRKFLTDESPSYTGITGYNLKILNAAEEAPDVSKLINRGSVFAFSDGKSIVGQQIGDGSIDVNCWIRKDEDPRNSSDAPISKETILKNYKDWSPQLVSFIEAADEIKCRSLYALSVGSKWKHTTGVTLIGDAAHLMTPFAGEGVNLAMKDSMRLASTITDAAKQGGINTLDGKIMEFEKDIFVRGQKAQKLTDGMMRNMFFTEGAPRTSIEPWILKRVAYSLSPWSFLLIYPLVASALYTYFFFFKLLI